jgi:hypothetical protein
VTDFVVPFRHAYISPSLPELKTQGPFYEKLIQA